MKLINEAKEILAENWMDGFTIPTHRLYPFQWNWDSGFTSLGISHYSLPDAIQELQSLFSGQWENGMVPHIIFHSENEKTYFPNYDFWDANVNEGAPNSPKTSGITQPPVHGFILEALLERFPDNPLLLDFTTAIFEKIVNSHRFLYTYRDPEREGLAFIFHPWESGRDNSPLWDDSLNRIELKNANLPKYERRDTSIADASERPTTDQYDRYVYLLELGKKYKYDEKAIFEESPFLIQDTLINTTLIKSNESLIRIGERMGFDVGELKEWQQQAVKAFRSKLWSEELSTFVVYDRRANTQIKHKEIGGIASLYASLPTQNQAKKLNEYLKSLHDRSYFVCPSFDVDSELFDSKRYWRGPVWPQMNWMIYHGLLNYGFSDTAQIVKDDLITLVSSHGFYEYFEAQKELAQQIDKGYGGNRFSWTAACVMDLIKQSS